MRLTIHVHHHMAAAPCATLEILGQIVHQLERLFAMSGSMTQAIAALTAAVEKLESTEDAVQAFVEGIPALIATAVAQAQAAGATPEQLRAFDELTARISTESADLTAAILANTPDAPTA